MSVESNFGSYITVFSPEGRIYQIEYAITAANNSRLTGLALQCQDGCILFSQLPTHDRLQDASNTTFIHKVNDTVHALVVGRSSDGRMLINQLRSEENKFFNEFGYHPTADILAERIGDVLQVYTQEAHMRCYGNLLFLTSFDEEGNPLLYRVSVGSVSKMRGYAAGSKYQEFNDALFNKKADFGNVEEGLRFGLGLYQKFVSAAMTGDDIEVAVVSKDGFKRLDTKRVDDILEQIRV